MPAERTPKLEWTRTDETSAPGRLAFMQVTVCGLCLSVPMPMQWDGTAFEVGWKWFVEVDAKGGRELATGEGDMSMTTKKSDKDKGQAVLVTTEHRGVFFGYLVGEPTKEKVMLTSMRNCVYWSADIKGFLGLAESGPSKSCKVGVSVPGQSTLFDVTGVYTCTDEAVVKWEQGPWA